MKTGFVNIWPRRAKEKIVNIRPVWHTLRKTSNMFDFSVGF